MEDKALFESRREMYRFLSRLYVLEVDGELLDALCKIKAPAECPDEDMAEGYGMMTSFLKESRERDTQAVLDDLAVDYARIFLSAGVAQGKAAFPYESVYTSRKHLMMQDSRNEVVALYAAKGFTPAEDMYRVPEDHLGLLLEYMALLCEECAEAQPPQDGAWGECPPSGNGERVYMECLPSGNGERVKASLTEQQAFLKEHLNNWAPAFAGEVQKYAATDFYKGLAKLTKGFLAAEGELLTGWEVEACA